MNQSYRDTGTCQNRNLEYWRCCANCSHVTKLQNFAVVIYALIEKQLCKVRGHNVNKLPSDSLPYVVRPNRLRKNDPPKVL